MIPMVFVMLVACLPKAPPVDAGESVQVDPLAQDAQDIWTQLAGEYTNHEQVVQQTFSGKEPYRELHHVMVPVEMPRLGERVLFVQQTMKGSEKPYRTRLYSLVPDTERGQVRLDIHKLEDETRWHYSYTEPEHLAALAAEAQFTPTPGCSVFWSRTEAGFRGATDEGTCVVQSARLGKTMVIQDDLTLEGEILTIQDVARDEDGAVIFGHPDGPPHINRRVQYYTGWSVVREGGPDYDKDAPVWQVHKGLRMHSEGSVIPLMDESGEAIPYRVELARLTRSASNTHLLKLAIVDVETGKTKAYTWADPNTSRLGINIGWAQVGLTREPLSPGFGHDREETEPLVTQLADYLSGELGSDAQAARDEDFRSIRLRSCRVQAPGLGRTVLYVEQAVATHLDAPYRQRLYAISAGKGEGEVVSSIYTLKSPEDFVGLCAHKALRQVHPSEAELKSGCEVNMVYADGIFRGSTEAGQCPSALRGASYATAEVVVGPEGIDSWDRGYDAAGEQVWGAEKGGYEFRRLEPSAQP